MFDILYTGAVLLLMTVALVGELFRPSLVLLTALVSLYLGGILTVNETFAGFSNHGMLTVGVLFIIAHALQSANSFGVAIERLLGRGRSRTVYFRLMLPVSLMSAFLNNTPIVASLIPTVKRWAQKNDLHASKFMIPLSYAAILGGICTLIGTSTNLIVHGLMLEHGLSGFSFFELGKVGLPIAVAIVVYFSLVGYRLLPNRKEIIDRFAESSREFVVGLKVGADYPYLGQTIENAHLRHLKGLYLFQIVRDNREIAPVRPSETVQLGDRLFFTGMPETIYELVKVPGLNLADEIGFDVKNIDSDKFKTFEAVLSNSSPLVGATVRASGFRTKYDAAILGIHRNGHRINQKVGDIQLRANDTLFILAGKEFDKRWYYSTDFSLVSNSVNRYSKPKVKGNLAMLLMALMVLSVTFGVIESMLIAATLTAGIMVFSNIISLSDARKALDMDVLLVIAASLGIGKAVGNAGLADVVAQHIIVGMEGFGMLGILAGMFYVTSLYTELITNNAAAAIVFPVALRAAEQMGVDPHPLMVIVTIAASSSFATPIGYQTNLMVYNPGGYRFTDYLRTGLVINLMVGLLSTALVYIIYCM